MAAEVHAGLVELTRAYQYARNLQCDPWQFAVAIGRLGRAGLTASDLRWLAVKRYVDHARELTRTGDAARRFQPERNLAFGRRSRFVLTDAGLAFVTRYFSPATVVRLAEWTAAAEAAILQPPSVPHYDRQRRTLLLGKQPVKRFRGRASCQEAVTAFQEEGWPDRIHDPLPAVPDYPPKQRLRETVRALNANQQQALIRFHGDGTGEGIYWELPGDGIVRFPTGGRQSSRAA
jgi:hypothetical protein